MNRLYLWLQRHPGLVDGTVAVLIGLLSLLVAGVPAAPGPLGWTVYVALILAIAIRRIWFPLAYLLVITAGLVNVAAGTAIMLTPAHLAMPILLYTAAAIGPRWARWLGLGWIPVAPVLCLWSQDVYGSLREISNPAPAAAFALLAGLLAAPLAAAWVWGDLTRTRRQFYEELADRAHRLEREREALDRAVVAEERARIARELHDVVAHHVSVMVVQADGAAYTLPTDDSNAGELTTAGTKQVRAALRTISRTGREAMAELRSLLGVLRADDGPDGADRTPQPGLDAIEGLMEQVRAAGLPVSYSVAGRPRSVAAGVSLVAFRVVQESLTNALKHGGPGVRAAVRLAWARDHLRVEVTDDGRGTSPSDTAPGVTGSVGHGIIGMRERVTAAGGTIRVGGQPGGGYQVTALLPLAGIKGTRVPRRDKGRTKVRMGAE
ncbi:MAG TPA: sensor histidine kinase [Micromonosporaceae bacterium]|nr:sensor histidine kinase [Micromonosporaceae bacterium]